MKTGKVAGNIMMIISCFALIGCSSGLKEWDRQEKKLRALIQQRATRDEVASALGLDFNDYSTSTNRATLYSFLDREPTPWNKKVREKAQQYPHVVQFSTPDIMTWVFFDEEDRVVDFLLSAQ